MAKLRAQQSAKSFEERWKTAVAIFQNKFFGQPKQNQLATCVPPQNDKEYRKLQDTYRSYDFDPGAVYRVWVCWNLSDYNITHSDVYEYSERRSIQRDLVELISFRDEIVPCIQKQISSSN